MVDYAVTPSLVQPTGSLGIQRGIAGAAITAGQPLRLTSGSLFPSQADSLSNLGTVIGIALSGGAIGQPIVYATGGTVNMGTTFAVGDAVVVSAATAGGIAPYADLASTNGVTILGIATTTALLKLEINNSGVVI